jgi:alkylation response protein AidB-like acyl-CoA dehydrogenase
MTGAAGFGEIFFDHVDVPVDNRIDERTGWGIARTSLLGGRGSPPERFYDRIVGRLIELARECGLAHVPSSVSAWPASGAQRIMSSACG